MKIRINPYRMVAFHRLVSLFCIGLFLWLPALPARSKPVPRNDGAGPALGFAALICGGVVVYCMIKTCQKVFGTNGTNQVTMELPASLWPSNQSSVCIWIDTCPPPCDCDTNQLTARAAFGIVHDLQRSTNLIDWDTIDTKWGEIDDLYFSDYDPPQAQATYRVVSW